jgi:hypothetical protein
VHALSRYARPDREAQASAGAGALVIFPEGDEVEPGQMLPFKPGAFVFALRTGLPVVPVAIHVHASPGPGAGSAGGAPARAAPAGEPVYSSRPSSGRRKP